MLVVAISAVVAFTLQPTLVTPTSLCECSVHVPRTASPQLGFFDDLKKGFENDPKLENKGLPSKETPAYVKKKIEERKRYEDQFGSKKAKEEQGGSRMDELFKGWRW